MRSLSYEWWNGVYVLMFVGMMFEDVFVFEIKCMMDDMWGYSEKVWCMCVIGRLFCFVV